MKKCFISIILFLFVFSLGLNIVSAEDEEPKTWFIKMDDKGNLITDAEFEMYSLFGNNTFIVNNESIETESLYTFYNTDEVSLEKGLSFLNDEQKSLISSIKTVAEYENKKEVLELNFSTEEEFYNALNTNKGIIGHVEYVHEEICENCEQTAPVLDYISLTATNFLVLEETKAPIGMERNKYIVPIEVTFYMSSDESNNLNVESVIYKTSNNLIKYDSKVNYKNLKEAYRYIIDNENTINHNIKTGCDDDYNRIWEIIPVRARETVTNTGDGLGNACSHNPIIVDKVGTYEVNVTSYVNDSPSVNVLKQDTVKIKVKLNNSGTVDSFNNVVVARIPKEVSYVEDSASDNGVYDGIEKTITWNIDRLDASSIKELTYDVVVPNNVKVDSNIIANASLNSDNVSEAIVSNDSTIRVKDIVNPKTGDFEKLGVVIALTIAAAILYILHSKNKFLNI